ncbi:MAG: hypothetical protein HY675_14875 [Chloroflexi bacterium]|nr:hypothetical protein [Chloroflexota bacterium]
MKFLVISRNKYAVPPDMALGIFDGMIAWTKQVQASGKLESLWVFAGVQAGGGVANVNSIEELDAMMSECPLTPFSDTEVIPLVEPLESFERTRKAILAMTPGGRGR